MKVRRQSGIDQIILVYVDRSVTENMSDLLCLFQNEDSKGCASSIMRLLKKGTRTSKTLPRKSLL